MKLFKIEAIRCIYSRFYFYYRINMLSLQEGLTFSYHILIITKKSFMNHKYKSTGIFPTLLGSTFNIACGILKKKSISLFGKSNYFMSENLNQ